MIETDMFLFLIKISCKRIVKKETDDENYLAISNF